MILEDIVPRDNIADYIIHDGDGRNAGLLREPLPPIPSWYGGMNTPVDLKPDVKAINLVQLFIELKLQTVTMDEMHRICEVLLRKEEANKGSIFCE